MSYQATVFNVMIASPSDVSPERGLVREIVYEWNATHSFSRKIVLQPIAWETHSSPSMGKPAQSILNEQILARCDLLIGVFWTRIGSKTDAYESGTVEEIERHIANKRPAMLYFSDKPVMLKSVDNEQYERLVKFKESCKARALYSQYENVQDFRDSLNRHLQLKLNEDPYFAIDPHGGPPSGAVTPSHASATPLSREAVHLLSEATSDPSGMIIYVRAVDGSNLQTNDKNIITDQSRRTIAAWEAALSELANRELIKKTASDPDLYEVTQSGYQLADTLSP